MYINFLQDRKALGYETCEDIQCGIKLVKISDRVFIAIKTLPCKVGEGKQTIKKTFAILAFGVLIFFVDPKPVKAIGTTMIPTQIERLSKANLYREIKPSVIIINVNYEKPPKIVKPQYLLINLILIIAKLQSRFMKIRGCQNQAKASLLLFLMTAQVKVTSLL